MRLTSDEIAGIIKGISANLQGHSAELRLFGSRVDDAGRGGDIDLLLILAPDIKSHFIANKHYVLVDIKTEIGEQRIDLKIATEDEIQSDPFLKAIYPASILINNFCRP